MRAVSVIFAGVLILSALGGGAKATEHEIAMRDGPEFDPPLVRIAPGDTVHFVAEGKGHNAESIDGMIPDGAQPFAGAVGEDLIVRLTAPGVYGYRCRPHASMGMVGLIVVGAPENEEAAKAAEPPGRARQAFAKQFRQLDGQVSAR